MECSYSEIFELLQVSAIKASLIFSTFSSVLYREHDTKVTNPWGTFVAAMGDLTRILPLLGVFPLLGFGFESKSNEYFLNPSFSSLKPSKK